MRFRGNDAKGTGSAFLETLLQASRDSAPDMFPDCSLHSKPGVASFATLSKGIMVAGLRGELPRAQGERMFENLKGVSKKFL